jgi:hypothetical protein
MSIDTLVNEIDLVFPFVEMPPSAELTFHKVGCTECDYLRDDLEMYRSKEVTGELIRFLHQEMSHLSGNAWRWILPHYLKFCLTPEAEYSRMETEFLIYGLGPDLKFQAEARQRFSMLSNAQVNCLIHFLEWCLNHPYWKDYCSSDIDRGLDFMKSMLE